MLKWFKSIPEFGLTPNQWKVLASASSNIGQGIILFALAAFFVPEAVGLPSSFPKDFSIKILLGGLILLISAIIMSRENN